MAADRLTQIQHAILGLLELKTAIALDKAHANCVAQVHGEHLAANSMLALRSQQGLDVPVLLTDGTTFYLASTAEGNSNYVLFSVLPHGAPSAASLLRFLLARSCSALCTSHSLPPSKVLTMPYKLGMVS